MVTGARLANNQAAQRRALIVGRVRELGHVSVSVLADTYHVTEMTIRRDLRQLQSEGLLTIVHGGARAAPGIPISFGARAMEQAAAKHRIGAAAVRLLGRRGTIGIDAGTTALEVALQLPARFSGTVVTHSVPVMTAMLSRPSIHTIGIGGDLVTETQALVSGMTLRMLSDIRLDTFVLGGNSLDDKGVYVHTALELAVKRAFIEAAREVILVIDSTKVGGIGAIRVCPLEQVRHIVTDVPLPGRLAMAADASGSDVTVC